MSDSDHISDIQTCYRWCTRLLETGNLASRKVEEHLARQHQHGSDPLITRGADDCSANSKPKPHYVGDEVYPPRRALSG